MSDVILRTGGMRSALGMKAPVRVATTANITLSGFQVIDGITISSTDTNQRVLVKNQTDQTTNGVYQMVSGLWPRDLDSKADGQWSFGSQVRVQSGTLGAGVWVCTASDPIVLGTSNITFVTETSLYGAGIEWVQDNGDSVLTVGLYDYLEAPYSGTIAIATLLGSASGSCAVDVRKCTFAQFDASVTHPVIGDSIVGTAFALSSAAKYQDTTLTGWTTLVTKGDIVQFIITATDGSLKKVTASLRLSRLG